MSERTADLGVLGMGTMGASLALNFADKGGFTVALGNRTVEKAYGVRDENPELAARLVPTDSIDHFISTLKSPRVVRLFVGKPPFRAGAVCARAGAARTSRGRTANRRMCVPCAISRSSTGPSTGPKL